MTPVSVYSSYSVSYLPSSGDQFSSLTVVTEQVKPERFNNYEAGVKWDIRPALALTTAVYRLDRTNTRSTDPNDPTRIVQTGATRTNGYELGLSGNVTQAWRVAAGYTWQDASIVRATVAAAAGAQVAQVPHQTLSIWNNYQCHPRLAAGRGRVVSLRPVRGRRQHRRAAVVRSGRRGSLFPADAAAAPSDQRRKHVQSEVLC
jgi:catecholate siderophore receptor